MEGVGSRLGRASSRYGQAPVFSGPVRKWKKQWVQVSSTAVSHHGANGNNGNSASIPSLRLCRWTPIPASHSGDSNQKPEEPPRRKFRYTPIVVLEGKKKEAGKGVASEVKTSPKMMNDSATTCAMGKNKTDDIIMEDTEAFGKEQADSTRSPLDLDLCLKGHDDKKENSSWSVLRPGASCGLG